jgi:hypothetical protein
MFAAKDFFNRIRPKADLTARDSDVRFWGQSGHSILIAECLLMTQLGK